MQHRDNRQDRQSSYRTHCDCSWRLFEELVGSYWPVANLYSCYRVVWTVYPFWNIHVQDKGLNVRPTVERNSVFLRACLKSGNCSENERGLRPFKQAISQKRRSIYRIVKAKMPSVRSMGQIADLGVDMKEEKEFIRFATPMRCVAMAEHTVKPGKEKAFEQGAVDTMEALSDSTGFLGYMLLKQIGVCALGSFMMDPKSMAQSLQTLGANPPKDPKPLFKTPEAMPSPPEYLIHSEWDAVEMAQLGFAKVLVNHRIRRIHDEGVMSHLIRGPYIMFFQPVMEEPGWRSMIS